MRKLPVAAIALVAAAAVVVPSAWPAIGTHPPTPRLYDNCTRYNAKYPHGVGRVGTRDRTSGTHTRGEMRRTAGLPGTGVSHTTQRQLRPSTEDELEQVPVEALNLEELNYLRGRAMRKLVGWEAPSSSSS